VSRELAAFFQGLGEWVAAAGVPVEVHAYGTHPDQEGELRRGGGRVAVVLHGGFWRATFGKANTAALAVALTQAGLTTWNLEYRRLGTGGGYPATLEDVACGIRELAPQAEVVVGHSTGGLLALWAAAEGLAPSAVGLAALSDLEWARTTGFGEHAVDEFFGGAPPADVDPRARTPLPARALLVHGDSDDRIPSTQSATFAEVAGECTLLSLEGADHFDVIDPRTSWWPSIEEAIDGLS
jgi:acetyl esterase/lipase